MILLQLLAIFLGLGGYLYIRLGGHGLYAPGSRRLPDWWPLAAAALVVMLVEVARQTIRAGPWTDRDLAGSAYNPASMSEAVLSADLVTIADENRGPLDAPGPNPEVQTWVGPGTSVGRISRLQSDERTRVHTRYELRGGATFEGIRNRSACGQRVQVRYGATSNAGGVPPISGERTIRLTC